MAHGRESTARVQSSSEAETTGWRPTCECNAETVPAVVLDCFGVLAPWDSWPTACNRRGAH